MEITINGKISDEKLSDLINQTQINQILEGKINDRINGIVNKHFNAENTTQHIRENFNKSVARLTKTDEFRNMLKDALKEKVIQIIEEKDFTKIINESVKQHIDSVVKSLTAIR